MNPFSYAVTLRIRHPGIGAAVISDTLKLSSHPVASALRSYWRHRYDTPLDSACAAFIQKAAADLEVHECFFRRIRAYGGAVEFFVGWGCGENFGDTFSFDTLALLARLQIDLSFDVYPDSSKRV